MQAAVCPEDNGWKKNKHTITGRGSCATKQQSLLPEATVLTWHFSLAKIFYFLVVFFPT